MQPHNRNAASASPSVRPLDRSLEAALRARIDGKAKPPGSLGVIEELAVRLGLIQNSLNPRLERPVLFVFAADHGLTEEGVSRYPASVTAAMVSTFLDGRACVNAFAAATGVEVRIVDAGVAADLPSNPNLISAKVRYGTRNAAREPALTASEVQSALARGRKLITDTIKAGSDVILLGEMGIGNTASSALIMHRLLPAPLGDCVGVGAGQDEAGLARKRDAIERAALRSAASAPLDVLAEFGGCEIAMMVGGILGAASEGHLVIIDGFIVSSAALTAARLEPAALDYCIFAHRSAERGHAQLMEALGAKPLLDLGMRLGEGTGAVFAVPLLRAAARLLTDVADLSEVLAGTQAP